MENVPAVSLKGTAFGASRAEGARKMRVQYDLDWDKFINMYVERLTKPTR